MSARGPNLGTRDGQVQWLITICWTQSLLHWTCHGGLLNGARIKRSMIRLTSNIWCLHWKFYIIMTDTIEITANTASLSHFDVIRRHSAPVSPENLRGSPEVYSGPAKTSNILQLTAWQFCCLFFGTVKLTQTHSLFVTSKKIRSRIEAGSKLHPSPSTMKHWKLRSRLLFGMN